MYFFKKSEIEMLSGGGMYNNPNNTNGGHTTYGGQGGGFVPTTPTSLQIDPQCVLGAVSTAAIGTAGGMLGGTPGMAIGGMVGLTAGIYTSCSINSFHMGPPN